MKIELLTLKSKVCGLEQTSRMIRKRITKASGMKRWGLRYDKSLLGFYTREHLIAYGLLRNIPYNKIEPLCAKGNEPDPKRILDIISSHTNWIEKRKWTLDTVTSLLSREKQ